MLSQLLTAAIGTVLLALGWVWVQQAWRRSFPEACADPDPLAGRLGCNGCTSEEKCERGAGRRCVPTGRENP